jgi:hypothetical protein
MIEDSYFEFCNLGFMAVYSVDSLEWTSIVSKSASNHANECFQVLASKEDHALGLKRRLGITAWREFSEDMTQGLKTIQVLNMYSILQMSAA